MSARLRRRPSNKQPESWNKKEYTRLGIYESGRFADLAASFANILCMNTSGIRHMKVNYCVISAEWVCDIRMYSFRGFWGSS